jgi:hypothetical protein
LATRAQYVNDGGEDLARPHGLATSTRLAKISATRWPLRNRNQWLNLRPVGTSQYILLTIKYQDRHYLRISS